LVDRDTLRSPETLEVGPDGNLYVTWNGNRAQEPSVHVYGPDGTDLGEFASLAGLSEYAADWHTGMAFGPDGELYVLDKGSGYGQAEIFRFEGPESVNAGDFIDVYINVDDYLHPERRLVGFDLEGGPDGNLYVGNEGFHEVLRFNTPGGDDFGYFGEIFASSHVTSDDPLNYPGFIPNNEGWSFDGGIRVRPLGIDWGPDGLFYVAATMNEPEITTLRISRFDADGNYIDEFVPLSAGYSASGNQIRDLDFGPDGNLYLVHNANNEIMVFAGPDKANAGALINTLTVPDGFEGDGITSLAFLIDEGSGDLLIA